MGRFRHRSLNIELKDRLRAARALLGLLPPVGVAHARRAIASEAIAEEIDVGVVVVGRPMMLEVVEEGRPIELQVVPPTE